ncbi:MAG: hypothetical protein Q3972_04145 [Corynebacterium sp.]|nr:hypothetical protein [Corynebacterium sp.]
MKRRQFLVLLGSAALCAACGSPGEVEKGLPVVTVSYPIDMPEAWRALPVQVHVFEPVGEVLIEGSTDDGWTTYRIRPSGRFHDGSRIISEDVAWTVAGTVASPDIDIVTDETLRLRSGVFDLGRLLVPKHAVDTPMRRAAWEAQPVGSGPYSFKSSDEQGINMVRFENYRGKSDAMAEVLRFAKPGKQEFNVEVNLIVESELHATWEKTDPELEIDFGDYEGLCFRFYH